MDHTPAHAHPVPDEVFAVHVAQNATGQTTVTVSGAVDLGTLDELTSAVAGVWDASPAHLVLDLRKVSFFSISALRVVVAARQQGQRTGTPVELHAGHSLTRLLAHLDQIA